MKLMAQALKSIEEKNVDKARTYTSKAKKQIFLAIEKLKRNGGY